MNALLPRRATARLVLLCLAQFVLILDVVVVNVALPSMRAELRIPDGQLSMVGVAYTLTFGALLVVFGRAGDLLDRRRLFAVGLSLFGLASLGAGLATTPALLFAFRAAQGVGAAMVSPNALALLLSAFPEGGGRNRALGVWGAVGSAGAIAGQLLGGLLVDAYGWRSVFLINVPLVVAVVSGVTALFQASPRRAGASLDIKGALLLTASLFGVTGSLVRLGDHGVDVVAVVLVVLAAAGFTALIRVERGQSAPIIDGRVLRSRAVRSGNTLVAANAGVVTVALFFTTLYLQLSLGMTPLAVGMSFAPVTLVVLAVSPLTGRLVSRWGVRPLLVAGSLSGFAGLLLLARVPETGSYVRDVFPGLLLLAIMGALSYAPAFVTGTSGIDEAKQGLAAGLLSTSQELGAAVGLAAISTVAVVVSGTATSAASYRAGFIATAVVAVGTLVVAARAPRGLGIAVAAPAERQDDELVGAGARR